MSTLGKNESEPRRAYVFEHTGVVSREFLIFADNREDALDRYLNGDAMAMDERYEERRPALHRVRRAPEEDRDA